MQGVNNLVGPRVAAVTSSGSADELTDTSEVAVDDGNGDKTEYIVAAFVLGALGLLVLFRVAGFSAVIATKVSVG